MPGLPLADTTPAKRAKSGKGVLLTPKRRKSLVNAAGEVKTPEDSNWENDDAAEKEAIRAHAKEARRASIGDLKSPARRADSPRVVAGGGIPALNDEQLSLLYQNCLKLAAENKITAKNTWNQNLIDYLDFVVKEKQGSEGQSRDTDFVRAGSLIDASAKIYATRVDAVNSDAYKVLGGFSRTAQQQGSDEQDEAQRADDDNAAELDEMNKSRYGGRRSRGECTLEANEASLNKKQELEMDFGVDPLFQKMSATFDEGGARGLLLNNLSISHGCNLAFDSSDAFSLGDPMTKQAVPPSSVIDLSNFKASLKARLSGGMRICPVLSALFAADGAPDNTAAAVAAAEAPAAEADSDDDEAFGEMPLADEVDFGENDDDDICAPAAELDCDEAAAVMEQGGSGGGGMMTVDRLEQVLAEGGSSEYEYFQPSGAMHDWAGLQHWKFRSSARLLSKKEEPAAADGTEGSDAAVGADKPKKAKVRINFATALTTEQLADLKPSRASIKSTDKPPEHRWLLPDDHQFSAERLSQLFLVPKMQLKRTVKCVETDGLTASADPCSYVDDSSVFCEPLLQDHDADDDDDDCGHDAGLMPADDAAPLGGGAVTLVDAPNKVAKIEIGYAKAAKRVDVKKLKEKLWDLMDLPEQGEPADSKAVAPRSFAKLSRDVPVAEFPHGSVPFYFICMLHLANEKCLKIDSQSDLLDLQIVADRD